MDYKDFLAGQTCENFWFKSKLQLIDILIQRVKQKNLKILDIGAGTGADIKVLNKYGSVHVIDKNQKALDLIPDNICYDKILTDAINLPYPENYFDVVCSFDVFEHIKHDNEVVSEILRVLKNQGFLFFTVPAFQILFSAHDKALLHFRRYNKKSLQNLLKEFKKLETSYWNAFLFLPLAIYRIIKKGAKPKLDYFALPKTLECFFLRLLNFENKLITKGYKLPIGLSIVGYCIK